MGLCAEVSAPVEPPRSKKSGHAPAQHLITVLAFVAECYIRTTPNASNSKNTRASDRKSFDLRSALVYQQKIDLINLGSIYPMGGFVVFFVSYHYKLKISGEDISLCHLGLWEIIMGIFTIAWHVLVKTISQLTKKIVCSLIENNESNSRLSETRVLQSCSCQSYSIYDNIKPERKIINFLHLRSCFTVASQTHDNQNSCQFMNWLIVSALYSSSGLLQWNFLCRTNSKDIY